MPVCNENNLALGGICAVVKLFERDANPIQDAALRELEFATQTLCPMAIGKAIHLLEREMTPPPQRVVAQNAGAIEILREARREVYRTPCMHGFPELSPLQKTLDMLTAIEWPQAGGVTATGDYMRVFAVLWANARSAEYLTGTGIHYIEAADQLGMDSKKEFYPMLARMRKLGFLSPSNGSGMVTMSPSTVEHFIQRGAPAPMPSKRTSPFL